MKVLTYQLPDDGTFPNNTRLPLLVYQAAMELTGKSPAAIIELLFADNSWVGSWRNGIYGFHHYHSTAHEVLGVYEGSARVQLGGPRGISLEIEKGDVIVIPAGVAHKNLKSTFGFRVVGAYPRGQRWDMNYGKPGERPKTDHNIARVPLPESDPVLGSTGPLMESWKG